MRSVVFCGGGTAGHVYPALAVAEALRKARPDLDFYYFVSPDGPEKDLIPKDDFTQIEVAAARTPLRKIDYLAFVWNNARGVLQARRKLKKLQPAFVFASGGFSAAPVVMAAKMLNIPFFLHEQNAFMGRVNRLFQKDARRVFTSFPEMSNGDPAATNYRHVGNPVREAFFTTTQEEAREALGIPAERQLLLVLGGSLGAQAFNNLISALPQTPGWRDFKERHPEFRILLVSGMINSRVFTTVFDEDEIIDAESYVNTQLWLPAADIILGRAGASILMEVAAAKKPSILVPFPQALNHHQDANAEVFKKNAAAVVVQEVDLEPEMFIYMLDEMLSNQDKMKSLSQKAGELAPVGAAGKIASELSEVLS